MSQSSAGLDAGYCGGFATPGPGMVAPDAVFRTTKCFRPLSLHSMPLFHICIYHASCCHVCGLREIKICIVLYCIVLYCTTRTEQPVYVVNPCLQKLKARFGVCKTGLSPVISYYLRLKDDISYVVLYVLYCGSILCAVCAFYVRIYIFYQIQVN